MSLLSLPTSATTGDREGGEGARAVSGSTPRGDIQGMRAIAVLLVMFGHANLMGLHGGYVGVDVFFVISGFLITGILARDAQARGRVSIADFYARRALRILPAATVVLLLVALASAVVYTAGNLSTSLHDIGWAAFFAANVNFARAGTGYFTASEFVSPVQHFWSLAVEEQFYLVWPALIAAVFALSRRQRTRCALDVSSRSHDIWLRRCAAAILLLTAASFVWSVVDTDSSPQPAYFSTLTRAWELGVGALLALAVAEVKGIPVRVRAIATWVGLAAILWAGVRYGDSTPFPGYHAALPVLGSALVLGGGIGAPAGGVAFLLDRRPMRFVGDISYSVYLWHWPLLILPAAYLGRPLAAYESLLVLVCAIGLAWLSYRWVEGPLRQGGTVPHKNSRALAMWPTATAAVMVAVVGLGAYAAPSTAAPAPPRDEAPAQLMASVKQAAASARAGAGLPDALTPTLTDLFGDITEPAPGCSASTAAQCFLGDATSTHTIVAWGDSHVGMWMRPLAELAAVKHYRIILFGKASCIPVDQQLFYKGKAYPQCDQFRSWALGQIRALKPERIIISGYVAQDFMDTSTGKRIPSMTGDTVSSKGSTLFRQAAERTLKQLVAIAPDVSVISDVTVLKESASTCLGSRTATRATCSVPLNIVVTDRNASWRAAAAAVGAHYVDVIPYLCDGQICPIVVGSTIVYRDQTHVTETYARALKPILARQLRLS